MNDAFQQEKVLADVKIFNILKGKNNNTEVEGLVRYEEFSITTTESVIIGSLSLQSIFSFSDFTGAFPYDMIYSLIEQVMKTINTVHELGYVLCDIKPQNIFIYSNNNYLIGDIGSSVEIGSKIIETTLEIIPDELTNVEKATISVDWWCFVTTILSLLNIKNHRKTMFKIDIEADVLTVKDEYIKNILLHIIENNK